MVENLKVTDVHVFWACIIMFDELILFLMVGVHFLFCGGISVMTTEQDTQ